jgi:threonine synthase
MNYLSTRNKALRVSGAGAIVQGLSADGGLFVPEHFPRITQAEFMQFAALEYPARAAFIIERFLPELKDKLAEFCEKAYARFDGDPAPCVKVDDGLYLLELWHGPTHAFKDVALTLLPYLLTGSKAVCGEAGETLILVATSGDTGKAALEGFKDVPGTRVMVFYPDDGVSVLQKLQMQTSAGGNVRVTAIKGNFDDAQTAVKNIFADG